MQKKNESTLEVVEVAKYIARKKPNDNIVKIEKFTAQKAQMCIITIMIFTGI